MAIFMSIEAGLGEGITAEVYADVLLDISGLLIVPKMLVTRIFSICIPCDVTVNYAELC